MSRHQAATSLVAGLAIIAAAPLTYWATQPAPAGQTVSTVNAAAAAALATFSPVTSGASGTSREPAAPAASGSSIVTSSHGPDATRGSSTSTWPGRSGSAPAPAGKPSTSATKPPPAPAAAPAGTPVRIEVPALGVDATIVPVGVDSAGAMQIPQDVSTIGWYRFGPAPGARTGSAVLSGHVDDYRQGVGVFANLGSLGPGDEVIVVDQTGDPRTFSVISREEWHKGEVPMNRLFDRGGKPRLVLITCGGSFNSSTLGYDDNIAVTAVPIAG